MNRTYTLPVPAAGWDLSIVVLGRPAGQGRVSFLGRGRAIHSNHAKLTPWRSAIIAAAHAAMAAQCRGPHRPAWQADPMEVDITVVVPRPKSAPKRLWPVTRSSTDIDHHVRAVHDALSAAGVWADDSQVVEVAARKTYPGAGLGEPGALIHVRALPDAAAGPGAVPLGEGVAAVGDD